MKANEVALNSFLSQTKTQFIIPVYQRNYYWTEEQCRQMFYDIPEVGNKPGSTHFIGSILFIHEGVYTTSEVKQLVVIDGQERLTTFALLYLALHKFALENDLEEKGTKLMTHIFLPTVVGVPKVCIDQLLFIHTLNCKLLVTNDKA